eukprot:CAMPEP_0116843278 /NCGR_PEP_ID=MMETSP0418-20121206/11998_1 /TAXON_ID=1158023 /ORGANISM="Astrosyne radiata, Strain 13vi08-1A" /LENGTH=431 /DNA_ID=CAMNT_0004474011 /DNA_START=232 /DNA_END=1527 /DNA_ORIENTATION=+
MASRREMPLYVTKPSALLSVLGSTFIIVDMCRRWKKAELKWSTRHRLIIGMCLFDICGSTAWFIGTWAMPQDERRIVGNVGTWGTCEAQGFFVQLVLGAVLYNSALALYYFLVIRQGWSEERVSRKVEPFMHIFSVLIAFTFAIVGLSKNLYNPSRWRCWIAKYPRRCEQSFENNGVSTCIRGDNADLYRWGMFFVPIWIAILFVTVVMALVYRKLRVLEKSSSRFLSRGGQTRSFALQAMLYVGVFYLTWIFHSISFITSEIWDEGWFELNMTALFFLPLQGFFNCIVYMLPRLQCIKKLRRRDPNGSDRMNRRRRFSGPLNAFEKGSASGVLRAWFGETTASASAMKKAASDGSGVINPERNLSGDLEDPNRSTDKGGNEERSDDRNDGCTIVEDQPQYECAPESPNSREETDQKNQQSVSFKSDSTEP